MAYQPPDFSTTAVITADTLISQTVDGAEFMDLFTLKRIYKAGGSSPKTRFNYKGFDSAYVRMQE